MKISRLRRVFLARGMHGTRIPRKGRKKPETVCSGNS